MPLERVASPVPPLPPTKEEPSPRSPRAFGKSKEMEQRPRREGEGVCCLLSSCRPDGLRGFESLPGSPEGLVNPEGHGSLPGFGAIGWCFRVPSARSVCISYSHNLSQVRFSVHGWQFIFTLFLLGIFFLSFFFFFFFFHPVPIDLQSNWRCRGVKTGIDTSKPLACVPVLLPARWGREAESLLPADLYSPPSFLLGAATGSVVFSGMGE